MQFHGEELLEIKPGEYINPSFWDSDYIGYDENGDEIPFPQTARSVSRKHNGGDFVIFPRFSTYNSSPMTYDALHNKMTDKDFRNLVIDIIKENLSNN